MKLLNNGKEKVFAFTWLILFYLSNPIFAQQKLEDLKLVSGTKNLIKDATTLVQGLSGGIIGLIILGLWLDYAINKEDRNQKSTIRLTIIILLILIGILTIGEIIKIFSGYFLQTPVDITK